MEQFVLMFSYSKF